VAGTVPASEFGIVQDTDGYANVRKSASSNGEVVGKVSDGDLVWIEETDKGDWQTISFSNKAGEQVSGHIHKSRLRALRQFTPLPVTRSDDKHIAFKQGENSVDIQVEKFDREKVSVTIAYEAGGTESVIEVNRRPIFGTDGGMPRWNYQKILVKQGPSTLSLPEAAIGDLFQPNIDKDSVAVLHDPISQTLYITTSNSDGAGGYVAAFKIFKIVRGRYASRLVLQPF
jgi:hypothetical protein